MAPVRALLRLLALALATGLLCVPYVALAALGRLVPRLERVARAGRLRLVRSWGEAGIAILGLRAAVFGETPAAPFLLVANHVSYLDVLVFAALAPGTFVAKREVARWPLLGGLARLAGTVFVDRTRPGDVARVRRALRAELAAGRPVVLFPEGTSSDGQSVLPFHPALFQPALDADVPVVCASLVYRLPSAGLSPERTGEPSSQRTVEQAVAWWGSMPFVSHLWRLLGLPAVELRVAIATERPRASERKALAREARRLVARGVARLRGERRTVEVLPRGWAERGEEAERAERAPLGSMP